MANEVSNYIIVENVNTEVTEKLKEIFKPNRREDSPFDIDVMTVDLVNRVYDNIWANGNKDYNRNWVVEVCGAKWFYGHITNEEETRVSIRMVSAWDPVIGFVEKLAEVLSNIKEDIWIEHTFEDEAYWLVGVHLAAKDYTSDEQLDMDDWDVPKIREGGTYYEEFEDELRNLMESEVNYYLKYVKDDNNE